MLARAHRSIPLLLTLLPGLALAGAAPLPGDALYAVSSPDGRRVVAVGAHGAIRVSGDGGDSWRTAPAPVGSTLSSVSMADPDHGFAVGMHGVLLATTDGGESWTRQPLPEGSAALHLLGVQALDPERALAVGTWGARLRTADGGQSWRDDPIEIGPEHPRFAWLDPAERARVRRGGSVREDVALQSVSCRPGTGHCALAGEFGTLQVSRDAGLTWSAAEIGAGVPAQIRDLAEGEVEAAPPPDLAALVAALAAEPSATLEVETFASPSEMRSGVSGGEPGLLFERIDARLESARALAEAAGAPSARLRAAGRPPWDLAEFGGADPALLERYLASRRAPEPALRWTLRLRPLLYDVALVDAVRALSVGLGGAVFYSEDGGQSWQSAPRVGSAALYAVAPGGEGAWIAGERGTLFSWGSEPFPGASAAGRGFLRGLAFAPGAPAVGFAVGEGGAILRTRDGGQGWERVFP